MNMRHGPKGKSFLFGETLITIENGGVKKKLVPADELDAVLDKTFNLPPIERVR
jgi:hypothetical protein